METRTKPENRSARRGASAALGVLLALLFAFPAAHVARGATFRSSATVSAKPGLPFTIADFNGDQRPDFARVLGGDQLGANGYDYAIWIQISGSGRRLIRLVAPFGGLSIEARDVNGDHAVDLVLSTAWLKQPVAILLNDGHGRFSRVAPNAFPAAFNTPKTALQGSSDRAMEPIALAQESSTGSAVPTSRSIAAGSDAGNTSIPQTQFVRASFAASRAGRAPPAALLLL